MEQKLDVPSRANAQAQCTDYTCRLNATDLAHLQ